MRYLHRGKNAKNVKSSLRVDSKSDYPNIPNAIAVFWSNEAESQLWNLPLEREGWIFFNWMLKNVVWLSKRKKTAARYGLAAFAASACTTSHT